MEKKKLDYVLLLVFMILSYLSLAVVNKIWPPGDSPYTFLRILSSLTVVGWYVILYRVMTNFYTNKWVRWSYVCLMVFHFTFTGIVHQRGGVAVSDLATSATIAYLSTLLGFGIVFYNVLKDVFTRRHDLVYSLLGASNIYFMIPLMFCYIYSLVALSDPSYVHADPMDVRTVLFNSFSYIWFVIAGIDYTAGKIGDVIQSIAVLEAIMGNLFIVFIIGRLMSRSEIE